MYTELNRLFLKREDWQHQTFERIKNDLFSVKDNRFIRFDSAEENHLVMIYGKSQVGKTTLILNMIGLKSECIPKVCETLRAGIPRGSSSTSTAIIYAKSINEKYGCTLSPLTDLSSKDTQYYDSKGMIDKLEKIRQQAENNKISPNSILFIYIPKNCFINDSATDNISIMDMPGIESRNHKEDIHVQNLMTKYIPISSVCIIACRSNEIQSLESLVLPSHLEWKRMEHRFVLVITYAYNDGSIKQYFKASQSMRNRKFYDYVNDVYTQEIRKILGKKNQIEVYPVDVGDSLEMLCKAEIKSDKDREEIIETKNRVLENLRKSIISHKGEKLKSALTDLEVIIKHYGEDEMKQIDEEIDTMSSKIEDYKKLIESASGDKEEFDSGQDELKSEIEELKKLSGKFSKRLNSFNPKLSDQTKQYISEDDSLYKKTSDTLYLNDKEKKILEFMRNTISESVEEYIRDLNKLIEQAAEIDADLNPAQIQLNLTQIQSDAEFYVINKENSIYPPKKGLFSIRKKVYFTSIEDICNSIQESINDYLKVYVRNCISKTDKLIRDKEQELDHYNSLVNQQDKKIQKYRSEIESFESKIKKLKCYKDEIDYKRTQDRKTLEMYLDYAEQAYMEQRNDVVSQINNKSKSAYDKLNLVLFLGLLDKDYQRATGGIYETGNKYSSTK